jgi:hypothetical protein
MGRVMYCASAAQTREVNSELIRIAASTPPGSERSSGGAKNSAAKT